MKVCKWCREPIQKGWERVRNQLIAPWIHKNGRYTCGDLSKSAEPADLRWEKVSASKVYGFPYDEEIAQGWAKEGDIFVKFILEVEMNDMIWYGTMRHVQQDLIDTPEMVDTTWDSLVIIVDRQLEEAGVKR